MTELNIYLKNKYPKGFETIVLLNMLVAPALIAFFMCFPKMRFSLKNRPEVFLSGKSTFGTCLGWGLFYICFSFILFSIICSIQSEEGYEFLALLFIMLPMLLTSFYMVGYYTNYKKTVRNAQKILDYVNANREPVNIDELQRYLDIPYFPQSDKIVSKLIVDLAASDIIRYKETAGKYVIEILVPELAVHYKPIVDESAPLVDCKYCGASGQRGKCEYCGNEL